MKLKLGQITDVQTGYIERISKKPAEPKHISIIQLRDIDVNGTIDYKNIKEQEISSKDRYPELYIGDVIFTAKGSKRSAGVIEKELKATTASNHYLIIRIKEEYKDKVMPGYVAFYLRQKPAMDYFEQCASGSHIPFVTAGSLKELIVELLPVDKQKTLAELGGLIAREDELEMELRELKKKYYKNSVEQLIKAGE